MRAVAVGVYIAQKALIRDERALIRCTEIKRNSDKCLSRAVISFLLNVGKLESEAIQQSSLNANDV